MLVMWYPPKGHHIEREAMTIEQTWIHSAMALGNI